MTEPTINLYQIDCNKFMADVPDKYYELAIVDPPYGIGEDGGRARTRGSKKTNGIKKNWDNQKPTKYYFNQLRRISDYQIIFGGNYFADLLPSSRGWIYWQKNMGGDFADGEMVYTNFDRVVKQYLQRSETFNRIHPTQKPIALYKWLLANYAKEGDKILDTHGGSMSIAIACYDLGFDLDLCEMDKDYFRDGKARFEAHRTKQRELKELGYAKTELQKINPVLF